MSLIFLLRYFGVMQGYNFGTKLLENIESSGVMKTLTHAASILGLMVVGACLEVWYQSK